MSSTTWLCPTCKRSLDDRLEGLSRSKTPVCPFCNTSLDPAAIADATESAIGEMGCGILSVAFLVGAGGMAWLAERVDWLQGWPVLVVPALVGVLACTLYFISAYGRISRRRAEPVPAWLRPTSGAPQASRSRNGPLPLWVQFPLGAGGCVLGGWMLSRVGSVEIAVYSSLACLFLGGLMFGAAERWPRTALLSLTAGTMGGSAGVAGICLLLLTGAWYFLAKFFLAQHDPSPYLDWSLWYPAAGAMLFGVWCFLKALSRLGRIRKAQDEPEPSSNSDNLADLNFVGRLILLAAAGGGCAGAVLGRANWERQGIDFLAAGLRFCGTFTCAMLLLFALVGLLGIPAWKPVRSEKMRALESRRQANRAAGVYHDGDSCPSCGFRYSWDGKACWNCNPPLA
jgi:hypothetical protein